MEDMTTKAALVFDIHRGTTHDGPGMRTTIFLKGCPLRCAWCHNPEGLGFDRELQWDTTRCIGCRRCLNACPTRALTDDTKGIHINRIVCRLCLQCAAACPSGALSATGRFWHLDDLVKETLKDRAFFAASDGGVTVSGGEPLARADFLIPFLNRLKREGINTALDTSGLASAEVFQAVFPHVDTFLYDIKLLDPALHRQWTGVGNELILENFRWLAGKLRRTAGKRLWVRTPLIPHVTATDDNIRAIGTFLRQEADHVAEYWELCTFNSICESKYRKLEIGWPLAGVPLLTQAQAEHCRQIARSCFSGVVVSGITRES